MDGIDAAILRTDGDTVIEPGQARVVSYDDTCRNLINQALQDAQTLKEGRRFRAALIRLNAP